MFLILFILAVELVRSFPTFPSPILLLVSSDISRGSCKEFITFKLNRAQGHMRVARWTAIFGYILYFWSLQLTET